LDNELLGPRDIYFIVLSGEQDGSSVGLDDISLIQFHK
jgi:hypothetical protein